MARTNVVVIEYEILEPGNVLGPSGLVEAIEQVRKELEHGGAVKLTRIVDFDLDEECLAVSTIVDVHEKRFE